MSYLTVVDHSTEDLLSCRLDGDRLSILGEVDQYTAPALAGYLAAARDNLDIAVIDLSGVTFFDSVGVSVLEKFALHERCEVVASPQVMRVTEILGCGALITQFPQAS